MHGITTVESTFIGDILNSEQAGAGNRVGRYLVCAPSGRVLGLRRWMGAVACPLTFALRNTETTTL